MLLTDDVDTGLRVLNFVQTSHRQTTYDDLVLIHLAQLLTSFASLFQSLVYIKIPML